MSKTNAIDSKRSASDTLENFYKESDTTYKKYDSDIPLTGFTWAIIMASYSQLNYSDAEVLSWYQGHNYSLSDSWVVDSFKKTTGSMMRGFMPRIHRLDYETGLSLLLALKHNKPLDHWVELTSGGDECYDCGRPLIFETDGIHMRLSAKTGACPYPNGFREFHSELKIPSGKIVFTDTVDKIVRPHYKRESGMQSEVERSTNYNKDTDGYSIVGGCGNTDPSVYGKNYVKGTPTLLAVGNRGNYGEGKLPLTRSKRLGAVCGNTWQYIATDHDYFMKHERALPHHADVISVQPGIYNVTYHGHYIDRDSNGPILFATLEWIRPADST